jgi:YidC/Oxa1 family membrane protein insertase
MFRLLGDAVGAAYHVVSAYAQVLAPLTGSLATVAAIIAFTVSVRLLLLPLSLSAARGQASQARLLPQVAELRKRHARNPDLLRAELAALYQRENTSSLAGCLPALLQLPFFSVMYRLFLDHTVNGTPNGLLSHDLLAAPLGSHWLGGPGPFSAQGAVFLGLLGLLGLVAWFSARLARQAAARSDPTAQSDAAVRPGGAIQPGGRARPARAAESGAAAPPATAARSLWAARRSGQAAQPAAARPAAVPGWLTRLLPYTTVVIAAIVPLAAGIYLLTTTAWTTAERALLRRRILPSGIAGPGRPGSALV